MEKINTNDTLSTEYCTTATPVTNYMVTKEAYTTNYGSIGYYPCKDEVVDLSATLQPARLTPAPPPFPVH
ncbi:hypothetical protein [Methanocalculus sp. MSAO_Arc2]|uniref:hypothetical protein n=1 Tax=Methanocalculus sp. MSAO_Arc2 TaxID=2293855 RepID=UPI0032179D62